MASTALQQAVDQLLRDRVGTSLDYYLSTARKANKSWEQIARDLNSLLGMEISWATVRRWAPAAVAS